MSSETVVSISLRKKADDLAVAAYCLLIEELAKTEPQKLIKKLRMGKSHIWIAKLTGELLNLANKRIADSIRESGLLEEVYTSR